MAPGLMSFAYTGTGFTSCSRSLQHDAGSPGHISQSCVRRTGCLCQSLPHKQAYISSVTPGNVAPGYARKFQLQSLFALKIHDKQDSIITQGQHDTHAPGAAYSRRHAAHCGPAGSARTR